MESPVKDSVVCFYHNQCLDGLAAAWCVARRYPEAVFYAMDYAEKEEDFTYCYETNRVLRKGEPVCGTIPADARIIVVDFSFPVQVMFDLRWRSATGGFVFLDHHPDSELIAQELLSTMNPARKKDLYVFDANRSGALLAWDHFGFLSTGYSSYVPPALIYFDDADRWQFKHPQTKAFLAGVVELGMDLQQWIGLPLESGLYAEEMVERGTPLRKQYESLRDTIVAQTRREIVFGGYPVTLINCPRPFMSEALEQCYQGKAFAIGYYDDATHRRFSMRSDRDSGVIVQYIAKLFGGNGHPHAAAFRVPHESVGQWMAENIRADLQLGIRP